MNFKRFLFLVCLVPLSMHVNQLKAQDTVQGAEIAQATDAVEVRGVAKRAEVSRVTVPGTTRMSQATARMPNIAVNLQGQGSATKPVKPSTVNPVSPIKPEVEKPEIKDPIKTDYDKCRLAYRDCMDDFCLLDEAEGQRCACSVNISQSKNIIQEIQAIQDEANKMYTEGVELEQLGSKAKFVSFGESEKAKSVSRATGLSFSQWLMSDGDKEALDSDDDIGAGLYGMAATYCEAKLVECGANAEMEEVLYSRLVVSDCKNFNSYLLDQKRNAEINKSAAEKAVRVARLEMLDTTNKYNRGECLLAYKSCISDKGGCGLNFENCLDVDLLGRRANACENVLEQCMAVSSYVLQDWKAESEMVLTEAAKYVDKNQRLTCFAKIQTCLEDGCSTGTNSACLTDVNVAAGICPIINECNVLVPGIKTSVSDKLGFMRSQFCQNDIDKCLQDKCGKSYTGPECVGKNTSQITALCPQKMFPSCNGEMQFNILVQATLLQMDYQMMQGCLNHFGEKLGESCGTDMSCLPRDSIVEGLMEIPDTEGKMADMRQKVRDNSAKEVKNFFVKFEKDMTVKACMDSQKPVGRQGLGASVFNSAVLIAEIGAENRAMRQLETKIAELSRTKDLKAAEENCYKTYKIEELGKDAKNYSVIESVSFEPSLRNCHVCRVQQVCEEGGESKGAGALKGLTGGLSAGAAAGTMVAPGWGTLAGGVIGGLGGMFAGKSGAGKETFCQEISSCEDVNM